MTEQKDRDSFVYWKPIFDWIVSLRLAPDARVVLETLAMHADKDGGNCYPTMRTVAKLTRLNNGRVKQLIAALEAAELIDITVAGGPRAPNHYLLNVGAQLSAPFKVAPRARGKVMWNHVRTKDAELCGTTSEHKHAAHAERSVGPRPNAAWDHVHTDQDTYQTNYQAPSMSFGHRRVAGAPRREPQVDISTGKQSAAAKTTAAGTKASATNGTAKSGRPGEQAALKEGQVGWVPPKPNGKAKPKTSSRFMEWLQYAGAQFARLHDQDPDAMLERLECEALDAGLCWPPRDDEQAAWRKRYCATVEAEARGYRGEVQAGLEDISYDADCDEATTH